MKISLSLADYTDRTRVFGTKREWNKRLLCVILYHLDYIQRLSCIADVKNITTNALPMYNRFSRRLPNTVNVNKNKLSCSYDNKESNKLSDYIIEKKGGVI